MNGQKMKRVEFFYVVPRQVFAAAGTNTAQLVLDSDADFEMHEVLIQRTQVAVTVEMFDAAAGGAGFQSAPVPIDLWGGSGQLPFAMIPQLWKKRQVFSFRIVNSFAGANNIDIVFFGYKLVPDNEQ